jgi:hypothetical protein
MGRDVVVVPGLPRGGEGDPGLFPQASERPMDPLPLRGFAAPAGVDEPDRASPDALFSPR